MANQFYVEPADIMPGLQSAMSGFRSFADAKAETEKTAQTQATRDELSNLYKSGTPEEVGDFFIQNPEVAKEFDVAKTAAAKMTREEEVATAWDIYTGKVEPASGMLAHAEEVINRGGSATESLQLAEMAQQDPEIAKRAAAGVLARYDTEGFKAYRESQGLGGDASAAPKQKTGAFLVRDDVTGKTSVAVGSYDTGTGKLTTETAEFSGMDVVSKLGETAREQSARKVGEAGDSQEATDKARRYSDIVTRGTSAAEGAATYKRGIELLKKIKTGGMNSVSLAAKRFFGVEAADEGELSNSLAKAVLSQYRETFGAAFTENEGKKLDKIEASFSKSPESNVRLLTQALKLSERTAERAIKAAERREDYETADDIRDLLAFTLSIDAPAKEPAPIETQPSAQPQQSLPAGVTEEDIAATMQLRGMTREQVLTKLGVR